MIRPQSQFRVVVFVLTLLISLSAQAVTFEVVAPEETPYDTPDANVGDGRCADSRGLCTLRAGIMETNALAGPDTLRLEPAYFYLNYATGVYSSGPNQGQSVYLAPGSAIPANVTPTREDRSVEGDLNITDDLVIESDGAILEPSGFGSEELHVFTILSGVRVDMTNISIQPISGLPHAGSAILNEGGLTLNNFRFYSMDLQVDGAPARGGAIYNAVGASLTLNDVYFSRSRAWNLDGRFPAQGGAIYNEGLVTVNEANFFISTAQIGNAANRGIQEAEGGAIYNAAGATLRMSTDTDYQIAFSLNEAISQNARGGGVYNAGTLELDGGNFSNNQTLDHDGRNVGRGGAIYNTGTFSGTDGSASRTSFFGNQSNLGGAIYTTRDFTMDHVLFEQNRSEQDGGAVYIQEGDVRFSVAAFSNAAVGGMGLQPTNRAGRDGGAIYAAGGSLTMEDSSLTMNRAGGNGGAIAFGTNYPLLNLLNVTVGDNQSGGAGSALYLETVDNASRVNSTTIFDNASTTTAAGVHVEDGSFEMTNTILAGNTDDSGNAYNCDGGGQIQSIGFNLLDEEVLSNCASIRSDADDVFVSDVSELEMDEFPARATNRTFYYELRQGSPAIDTARATTPAPNAYPACSTNDQLIDSEYPTVWSRPRNGDGRNGPRCDIGAYEAPTVSQCGTAVDSNPGVVGVCQMRECNPEDGSFRTVARERFTTCNDGLSCTTYSYCDGAGACIADPADSTTCCANPADSDGDGTQDCNDQCPNDRNKLAPGLCGCGVMDYDRDFDGIPDCNDICPELPNIDRDADGDVDTADCFNWCAPERDPSPLPLSTQCTQRRVCNPATGVWSTTTHTVTNGRSSFEGMQCDDGQDCSSFTVCTAGSCVPHPFYGTNTCPACSDTGDTDGDGTRNCDDQCPSDPLRTAPGVCGCGQAETDTDGDGIADCNDNCPDVANADQADADADDLGDACEILEVRAPSFTCLPRNPLMNRPATSVTTMCQAGSDGLNISTMTVVCPDGTRQNLNTAVNPPPAVPCTLTDYNSHTIALELTDVRDRAVTPSPTATVRAVGCGDGALQEGEGCDDGNSNDADACSNACVLASCGDGVVQAGEECDDGNAVDTDACVRCNAAECGDGFTRAGTEQCDDGNRIAGDACTNTCTTPACGDGIVQEGEGCDDANSVNTDSCVSCALARCGDGVIQAGIEACDDGNQIDGDTCTNNCALPTCGDLIVQAGEECDDGNSMNNDACVACQNAECGDGFIRQGTEQCDDANPTNDDACTNGCRLAVCGDGIVQGGEECDDGNSVNADSCSTQCRVCSTEICDGLDNDCDGDTDENNPGGGGACQTGQAGLCAEGELACNNGGLECVGDVPPGVETCDGEDNNCNGQIDEDLGRISCGVGACRATVDACVNGSANACVPLAPGAEICDGIDNDCDGLIDEGCATDLRLEEEVSEPTVSVGAQVRYTIVVTNNGPVDATEVVIANQLSDQFALLDQQTGAAECRVENGNPRCTLPMLRVGESIELSFLIVPEREGSVLHRARVDSAVPELTPDDNEDSSDLQILAQVDNEPGNPQVQPGQGSSGWMMIGSSSPIEIVAWALLMFGAWSTRTVKEFKEKKASKRRLG